MATPLLTHQGNVPLPVCLRTLGLLGAVASPSTCQRGLPRPMVAKILTALSQAHLVNGSPGPGGGYALARAPAEITLRQVYDLFEREDRSNLCPFGGGICGVGKPCALHDQLVATQRNITEFLASTTFENFRIAFQEHGLTPVSKDAVPEQPRESYRAAERRRPT